jgi:hypothetical protein
MNNMDNKKKNAIVVLSKGYGSTQGYHNLIKRNVHILNNVFEKKTDTDIIIFHEGDIIKEHQQYISNFTPQLNLIFKDVKKTEPFTGFDDSRDKVNNDLCPPTRQSMMFRLGYKHMCHFWSIDFLDYLKEYKFIIRIDEDCFVYQYDKQILNKMGQDEKYFISPYFQGQDEWYVVVGLEKLWNDFLGVKGIPCSTKFSDILCPYTNFMIIDIENIRKNKIISEFLLEVEKSHGIYSNRWGDLPIWGLILSSLIDKKHYGENKNIKYYHGSHNKNINI